MTDKLHALSIIIPTLNEEKYLPALLTDLSLQTFTDFEVIIVDGSSADRTLEKATLFQHRLSGLAIVNSPVRNVCAQRNLGVESAKASTILFMDADNRLPTYFLQGLKYRLDQTNPDVFTTLISPDSNTENSTAVATVINLYIDLLKNTSNPLTIEAMLGFKIDVFRKLKGFNPRVTVNEGNDIVKKALKKNYRFELFKDPTYAFSLRRLRKQGTFQMIGNVAQLEVARILGKKIPAKKAADLYPMRGGSFFDWEKGKGHKDKLIQLARSFLFSSVDE